MKQRLMLAMEVTRRLSPMYAVLAFLIIGLGWLRKMAIADGEALAVARVSSVTAIGMTAAWLLAMMVQGHLQKRELVQLPVSRRDVWLCRWWLVVGGAGLVTAVASEIGAAIVNYRSPGLVTQSHVATTAACSALWGGLQLFHVRVPKVLGNWFDAQPPHSSARTIGARIAVVWVIGWVLAPLALPFFVAPTIVRILEANSPAGLTVMALWGALVLSRYVHTPPVKERPPIPRASRPDAASVATTTSATATSGVTGLRFMYWKTARRHLMFFLVTLTGVVGYWLVAESRTYSLTGALRAYWLLPFDGRGSTVPVPLVVLLFMWLAQDDAQAEIRRLRTLPLSGWSLSVALTLRAGLAPLLLWLMGLLLHVCVLQTLPVIWHTNALLLATGAFSFLGALALAVAGSRTAQSAIFATAMLSGFAMDRFAPGFRPDAELTGLLLLATAMKLSEWAILRRSPLYSRPRGSAAFPERFS